MANELSKQLTGNVGLFYVCLELSKLGWNVLLTSRNAKGVDVVVYSEEAKRTRTIQVKALSGLEAVSIGKNVNSLIADFVVICRMVLEPKPEVFILTNKEAKSIIHSQNDGSHWLEKKDYEAFRNDDWSNIGNGRD